MILGLYFSADKIKRIENKCKSEHMWLDDFEQDFAKKHLHMSMYLRDKDFITYVNAMADKFIETGTI